MKCLLNILAIEVLIRQSEVIAKRQVSWACFGDVIGVEGTSSSGDHADDDVAGHLCTSALWLELLSNKDRKKLKMKQKYIDTHTKEK